MFTALIVGHFKNIGKKGIRTFVFIKHPCFLLSSLHF